MSEQSVAPGQTANDVPLADEEPNALIAELVEPLYGTWFLQTDARGQITGWNSNAEQTFGWPRQEVLGQAFADILIPPESRDEYRAGLEAFLATGEQPVLGRVRLRHRDGQLLPVALAIVPIPLELGFEFNRLLQGLRQPLTTSGDIERLNSTHSDVIESIRQSLRSGLLGHELASDFWRRDSIAFPAPLPEPEEGEDEAAKSDDEGARRLGGALAIYRLLGGPQEAAEEQEEEAEQDPAEALEHAQSRIEALEAERDQALRRLVELQEELETTRTETDELRRHVAEADAAVQEAEQRAHEAREELARLRSDTPTPPAAPQPEEPVARRASQIGLRPALVAPERIEAAIEQNAFQVYWQPVLSLSNDEIHHVELLLRLEDDAGRLMLPEVFLEAAREAGLMLQVDHWVLRYALELMSKRPSLRLALNLSGEAVADPETPSVFEQEIAAWGAEPSNLIVDVSERHAVNQMDAANRLQKRLRALGVGFSLDDFGSTFGSFRCLKQLRLDFLKLDADLIDTVMESRTDQLVVKALVDVAAGLGVRTIAEHVSDEETLEHLRGVGVGLAQGYAIGRPKPVSELPDAEQMSA